MIEYYEAFIEYFMGLNLSGQILTGILIIVGLIATGYIIYGAIWIAYQSIKFSVILTVIVIYLVIALVTVSISAIANEGNIGKLWSKKSQDIQKIISSAYNFDKSPVESHKSVKKPKFNTAPPVIILEQTKDLSTTSTLDKKIIPKTKIDENYATDIEEIYPIQEQKIKISDEEIQSLKKQGFCPNCGNKFTPKMQNVLDEMSFTFCESCGEKFYKRD